MVTRRGEPIQVQQEREQLRLADRERNKTMICDPKGWPRWPLLPMKKQREGGGFPKCGVLFAFAPTGERFTVYEDVPFFGPREGQAVPKTWGDLLGLASELHRFPSCDALLDAGWEVD